LRFVVLEIFLIFSSNFVIVLKQILKVYRTLRNIHHRRQKYQKLLLQQLYYYEISKQHPVKWTATVGLSASSAGTSLNRPPPIKGVRPVVFGRGGGGAPVTGGGGEGAENIKYKFRFASKFAKHLHQSVILMGGSYTSFSHLT